MNMSEIYEAARAVAEDSNSDVFLYNGEIQRGKDLEFIECVFENKLRDNVLLCLTTRGGSPDAGYKMARYLQDKYEEVRVLVSGLCKSAGTLIAVGATEIVFSPYGELGPIDIQKRKVDSLVENQSGLVTTDAIETLTNDAIKSHIHTFFEVDLRPVSSSIFE